MSDGHAAASAAPSTEPATPLAPEDFDVADAIQRGETRRALALSVDRHGASIGRLCMAMLGSQAEADDVTEATLLAAHQRFGEWLGRSSLRAWLLGIARNECLQKLEKRRQSGRKPARAAQFGSEEPSGVQLAAQRARGLLERVRPSDRDVLLLRFLADLSFEELAVASASDVATAQKRVSRALSRLRSALGSEDDDE